MNKERKIVSDDEYAGYTEFGLEWLKKEELKVWDEIEIIKNGSCIKGVILPRSEIADTHFISIKLKTGYNIGIHVEGISSVTKVGRMKGDYKVPKSNISPKSELPLVSVLGCGGTIACRLDYRTGGTIPALTPDELYSAFPKLADLAQIEPTLIFDIFSENIDFSHYKKILTKIKSIIKTQNPKAIVITHGTDTMAFTAAALSFAITNSPIPICITGSQRSSDRPSSDSFMNLYNSVFYATSPRSINEIVIIMHEESSDTSCAIHRPTRVRKMHSSRRDAFRTIGEPPLGRIVNGRIIYSKYLDNSLQNSSSNDKVFSIKERFEPNVGLLYHHPGIQSGLIEYYMNEDYKGLVIAGTGLGHVSSNLFPTIKDAIDNGMIIVMTTQCLSGFTGMYVYESGRKLQKIGVVPVYNILPEVAYVKLAYLLGNYKKRNLIEDLMRKNLKGEILSHERFQFFT